MCYSYTMITSGPGRINYDTHISHFALTGRWEQFGLTLSDQDRQTLSSELCTRGVLSGEKSMPHGYDYDRGDIALAAKTQLLSRPVCIELRYKAEADGWSLTLYQSISGTLRAIEARYMRPELQRLVEGWFIVGPVQSENRSYSGNV